MGGRVGECAGPASEIALSRFRKQPLRPRARLRIGSQQAHPLGLESQLVERIVDRWIARLADDIGVEFGRREAAAALIAFELGHVDAVGREAAERLVERGGRSAEHTSELQSLMRNSYAVLCLKKTPSNWTNTPH